MPRRRTDHLTGIVDAVGGADNTKVLHTERAVPEERVARAARGGGAYNLAQVIEVIRKAPRAAERAQVGDRTVLPQSSMPVATGNLADVVDRAGGKGRAEIDDVVGARHTAVL